jgi:CspA family cold shock protein
MTAAPKRKESTMKYFGTVKTFDNEKGLGSLTPETGGEELKFERSAISWDAPKQPNIGERLSYDKGTANNQPCAVNLARI